MTAHLLSCSPASSKTLLRLTGSALFAHHRVGLCFWILLLATPAFRAQNNEWELVNAGGPRSGMSPGAPGIYGTFQTPALGNSPGGRQNPVTWSDKNGNLWLFGGVGCDAVGNCGALDDLWEYFPTTNEWAWMAGDSKMPGAYQTQGPVYGTYQTPAAGNTPGARDTPAVWADQNGNLWLFGGFYEVNTQTTTYYSYLNDLWEFNTTVNQWAWMGGSSTLPVCGTGPITCNQHGVYGTLGTPAPANLPGGRHQSVSWTDTNGDVWLFGGIGADSTGVVGYLNDLWEFNPSTSQWTWMGGSNTFVNCSYAGGCGVAGVYGTKGQPDSSNIPGGRAGEAKWTDNKGNFWLFGDDGAVNDLWEFSPSTREWTWVGGSSSASGSTGFGVYGTLQVPATGNFPGTRSGAVAWTDSQGNLWLFGGSGENASEWGVDLNDLWKYNPATNEWAWMDGDSSLPYQIVSAAGYQGTLGQPAFGNNPGTRASSAGWTDTHGNFWLFGGGSLGSGYLNDLWQFQPYTGGQTQAATPAFSPAPGAYPSSQSVSITTTTPGATVYYVLNGAPPAKQYTSPISISGLDTINAVAEATGYANSIVAQATYIVGSPQASPPAFNPSAVSAGGIYTQPISVFMSSATPNATIYYTTDGTTPNSQSTPYNGPVSVSTAETIEAITTAPGYSNSAVSTIFYNVSINPAASPTFNPPPGPYTSPQTVTISDTTPNAVIYYTTDGTLPTTQSTKYTQPISVSSTETIEAVAVAPGGSNSPASFGQYTINLPVPPNTWTWVRGDPFTIEPTGTYGVLGLASAQDFPGGRTAAASWTDASGNFWLFGGSGIDAIGNQGAMNDLWEYKSGAQIQDGQWVWMGGSSTLSSTLSCAPQSTVICPGQPGVYGTQGQPAAGNVPGGRMGAVTWVDGSGNLWLFGGVGGQLDTYAGSHGIQIYFNDLWKFNPLANQWTWISGSNTANQFGVYGTLGSPAPGNVPGGRYGAMGWVDHSGNLWMFGGDGIVNGYGSVNTNQIEWVLNDLWMFNPSTSQWTWMGGSSTFPCIPINNECAPPSGVYGTMGTPNAANTPGSRAYAATWTDAAGNFWLFGGSGYDSQGNWGEPNDLWTYNPASNQWTWMNGSNTVPCGYNAPLGADLCTNPPAVRGTLGVPAAANTPPGGLAAARWTDKQGNFWIFGSADNLDITGEFEGTSSDIWVYNPTMNQWAWMGGDSATSNCAWLDDIPIAGNYECQGSQGVTGPEYLPAIDSLPPSRAGAVGWTDTNGNFWLFSGEANQLVNFNYSLQFGDFNDLWKFQPSATTLPPASTPLFSLLPGTYASGGPLSISNGMANASVYYTTDGSTPTTSSTLYTGPIQVSSTVTVQAVATAPGYINSSVASASYTLLTTPPPPIFSVASGIYSSSQVLTLSDANAASEFFYTTDGTTPYFGAADAYTGPITVSSSETVNAIAYVHGNTVTGYIASIFGQGSFQSGVASATYTINLPQVATPTFSVPAGTYASAQGVTLSDTTIGATIYYTTDGSIPTVQSTAYSGPISVSKTETIQAIATENGYTQSALATAAYTIDLPPPGFTVAGTAVTVSPGATSGNTSTITLTPSGGFTGTVNLTCAITPTAASDPATCGIPQSVTISGASAQTTTLTVNTTAAASAHNDAGKLFWPSVGGSVLACALLVGNPVRRRRRWQSLLGIVLLLFSINAGVAACGGGGSGGGGGGGNLGTTPGAYSITVTGVSGAITQTGTVVLTVQ